MMNNFTILTNTLKQSGLRLTPQRIAICKVLAETNHHPTASSIYEKIKPEYPSLSLGTVYNTLEILVAHGKVNVLGDAGDGKVHFDPETKPHINLACIQCHQIIDIPSIHVSSLDEEITQTSGFNLLGSRLIYYGICPACQNRVVE